MTEPEDWRFRSDYLAQMATYLDKKADELRDEAERYRGLAEQAARLTAIGQHR